jgi:hypothetical protein
MNFFTHNQRFLRTAMVLMLVLGMIEGSFAPLTAYADVVTPAPQTFTFSTAGVTSWTAPTGTQSVRVQVWGAGGSGGKGAQSGSTALPGRGGGAGGYAESTFTVAEGTSHTITVGQGGQSVAEGAARNGGDSSFDLNVAASGGIGGLRTSTEGTVPPASAIAAHCDYEGTWVYHDQGGSSNGVGGNDFGVSCRSQKITGFCQINSVTTGLDRGLHAGNYVCEGGSTVTSGIACDFEGSWAYTDEGGGNDFAFTCRNSKITGYCGATNLQRGFNAGDYTCEYGLGDDGSTRCNFDGSWSYNDEGGGNDFAFTCHNSHLTGMCSLTPLQRGGPQATYTCETYTTPIPGGSGSGSVGGGFGNVLLNLRNAGQQFASAFTSLFKTNIAFADMIFTSLGGQGLQGTILQNGADGAAISGQVGSAGGSAYQGGVGGATAADGAAPGGAGGGGTTSNGGNGGNGQVIVTVTFAAINNGGGGTPPTNPPVTPTNHAPSAPVVTWVGSTINAAVNFTAIATDPENDQVSCGFDWNSDGIVDQWTAFVPSGTPCTASNTWATAGSYPIQVFARDSSGAVSSAFTGTVVINGVVVPLVNGSLAVTITASPTSAAITAGGIAPIFIQSIITGNTNSITHHGIEVSFNAGAYTNAGAWPAPVANVLRSSDASFVALVLNQPGTYNFRTYTSQDNGVTYVYSTPTTVTITQTPTGVGNRAPLAPIVSWVGTTTNIATVFTATSTDPDGDQISYGFDWNNDGVADSWTSVVSSGIPAQISNTFTVAGSYPIQVFTKDSSNVISPAFLGTVVIVDPASGGSNSGGNTGGGSTTTGGTSGGGNGGGGGGYTGPCIGNCPATSTPETMITLDTVNNGGGSVTYNGPALVCPIVNFLTVFMRKGIDNNPNEVRKLQYFLNTHENAGLVMDGDFGTSTEAAVKVFQAHYANEILAPWGTTTPTGIVYITTTRKINEIYCGENPNYNGNADLKDIIDTNVLNTPDTSSQFNGVMGQATSTSSNIAGVFGAISGRVIDFLRSIPIYELLILILLILGITFILKGTLQKDIESYITYSALMRGLAALIVAIVLNVLNTLSFMLNPGWLGDKIGLTLQWVLALDIANGIAVIIICFSVLVALYKKLSNLGKNTPVVTK